MKLSSLQLFSALFGTVLGSETNDASDVYDLSESDFQQHVDSHKLVLAEFFAPWCGHCKNLAPEYEQAATELKQGPEDITLVKVDCVQNQNFCQQQGIQGFPTLQIFEDGENTGQYEGPRKAEGIKQFMLNRAQPVVTDVKDASGLKSWLEEHESAPVVVLYLGAKKHLDTVAAVAKQKRQHVPFVSAAEDSALREKYDDADVVIIKNERIITFPSDSKFTKDSLYEFVHNNQFPSFGELGPETYSAYIQHGLPMLYAFVDDHESRELVKSALTPHLETLTGKANVVFLNASLYGMHTENVNLRANQFPAIVVHDVNTNKKYVHDQDITLSEKSIADFVKKYAAGKIEPQVKSEPVPESQEGPVFHLVGSQYDEIVLDDSKDVLVEYFAPWCGHCKNLKPIYDQLGEAYAGNSKVIVAQLDHTLNEVPDQIQGYPTIKLYRAGKKDEPLTYEGSRTLEGLSAFIEKEGTHKAAPGEVEDDVKEEL